MSGPAYSQEIPPQVKAMQLITGIWASQAMYMACKLTLPDLLAGGARTAEELADVVQAQPRPLYRLMRALASFGVLEEDGQGRFALTATGHLLRSDAPGSLRWLALYLVEAEWDPWRQALHSIRSGETAIEHLFGAPLFVHLQHRPDLQQSFSKAMAGMAQQLAIAVSAAYDFSRAAVVVDVGGGRGDLILHLLKDNPQMKGIVFDLPHVIKDGGAAAEDADLRDRCEFVGGSFFEAIPAGGDLYLMSYIIHDWDDARAIEILKRCLEAMSPESRLLLMEVVLPAPGIPSFGKLLDLEMLVIGGGQERTEQEYRNLLDQAGFYLKQVIPTAAPQSIIETVRRA
jgi:O-methyltransferase domain/Dimerisation domain